MELYEREISFLVLSFERSTWSRLGENPTLAPSSGYNLFGLSNLDSPESKSNATINHNKKLEEDECDVVKEDNGDDKEKGVDDLTLSGLSKY